MFFVNTNELLPDQQKYLEDILEHQRHSADVIRLCTCLYGGPARPTKKQKAEIRAARERCPIHGNQRRK